MTRFQNRFLAIMSDLVGYTADDVCPSQRRSPLRPSPHDWEGPPPPGDGRAESILWASGTGKRPHFLLRCFTNGSWKPKPDGRRRTDAP